MEFSEEQWAGLFRHARDCNLVFLSSPFSVAAVELLTRIGVAAWKVGSGEVFNNELLSAIMQNKAPILLSTGMCSLEEIEDCVARIQKIGVAFALFQCTSQYPVSLEKVGLNVMVQLQQRFNCPVGLSDHSGEIFPALAALAEGANMIETHVVFNKKMFGPDTQASITLDQLRFLIEARDAFWTMRTHPVDKDQMASSLAETKRIFSKSLAPRRELPASTILQADMLTLKKPGTGIPETELENIIGRRLKNNVASDRILTWEDIDV
jgi:N-acetylneuraminate synthase